MNSKLILRELADNFHNLNDKYKAHYQIKERLKELCYDNNFIHDAIKNCITSNNFLFNAENLFFYLLIEGDVIIAINLFPPIYDKEKDITHDNIHHHGWRLLSTGLILGDGYETINFVKNSHLNRVGDAVKLEIENMYRHKKGEIKFIDSDQAHVVFQPPKTSATLALWSADRPLKNQKIKRLIRNFPKLQKFISKAIHKTGTNKVFGLNQAKGVYFHPENGKIIETKNYSKPTDGTRTEILHCMFKFFQLIELNDKKFFSKLKENCPQEAKVLCDKLIFNETIEDLGIKGDLKRRFSKNQILQIINN